jgi:hypothetical protein
MKKLVLVIAIGLNFILNNYSQASSEKAFFHLSPLYLMDSGDFSIGGGIGLKIGGGYQNKNYGWEVNWIDSLSERKTNGVITIINTPSGTKTYTAARIGTLLADFKYYFNPDDTIKRYFLIGANLYTMKSMGDVFSGYGLDLGVGLDQNLTESLSFNLFAQYGISWVTRATIDSITANLQSGGYSKNLLSMGIGLSWAWPINTSSKYETKIKIEETKDVFLKRMAEKAIAMGAKINLIDNELGVLQFSYSKSGFLSSFDVDATIKITKEEENMNASISADSPKQIFRQEDVKKFVNELLFSTNEKEQVEK